jgi:hypothetical protein
MQGEKKSKCGKHENRQLEGKGNILHVYLGTLKVLGGRRSRYARVVLHVVHVWCLSE